MMRNNSLLRFVVLPALVITSLLIGACADNSGPIDPGPTTGPLTITVTLPTCPNGSVPGTYCSRTAFPVKFKGDWPEAGSIDMFQQPDGSFKLTVISPVGRRTISIIDAGACDPNINGCILPLTGRGISVTAEGNTIRLLDGATSTSYDFTPPNQIRP